MENSIRIESVDVAKKEIEQNTKALVARATKFTITDPASLQKSSGVLSDIAAAKKKANAVRFSLTKPLDESKKRIMALFSPFIDQFDKATGIIKDKVRNYYFIEEEKAKKAEKERLIAEIKREEEIKKAEEEDRKPEPAIVEIPAVPEVKAPEKTVRGVAGGSMTVKKVWKFEIINPNQVPKEYWEINESLIREAVRNGARQIEGIRIYEDKVVSVR